MLRTIMRSTAETDIEAEDKLAITKLYIFIEGTKTKASRSPDWVKSHQGSLTDYRGRQLDILLGTLAEKVGKPARNPRSAVTVLGIKPQHVEDLGVMARGAGKKEDL